MCVCVSERFSLEREGGGGGGGGGGVVCILVFTPVEAVNTETDVHKCGVGVSEALTIGHRDNCNQPE